MFTANHFIWLAGCAVVIAVGAELAVRKKISRRTACAIMSAICVLSESVKIMNRMEPSPFGGYALDPAALPFHLCSIQIFIVFYMTFAKDGPTKDKVASFSVPAALLGGFMALIIPVDGVEFWNSEAWQGFGYHSGLVWLAIYFLRTRQVDLGWKAYGRNLLLLAGLAVVMIYVNGAFFAYGTNFLFVTRPPMDGLPILNLDHGWGVYFLSLCGVAVALMTLLHLPFLIAERRK